MSAFYSIYYTKEHERVAFERNSRERESLERNSREREIFERNSQTSAAYFTLFTV